MKKTWKAVLRSVRAHGVHTYTEDRRRIHAHQVRLLVTVSDGPETGREVEVWLSPDMAEAFARRLITQAADARRDARHY